MDSTDLSASDSCDSMFVGEPRRRVPIKLPNISPDMDLNQVELEVIDEGKEFPDRPPVTLGSEQKKNQHKTSISTKTKVRIFFYFACCLCICHRSKKTTAVVPSVAHKYIVADNQPY